MSLRPKADSVLTLIAAFSQAALLHATYRCCRTQCAILMSLYYCLGKPEGAGQLRCSIHYEIVSRAALSEERSVDAARPSAGIGREPSVSQPPAARAAALEQEVVSSPIHRAGESAGVPLSHPCMLPFL